MTLVKAAHSVSGDFDSDAAGTVKAGTSLFVGDQIQKIAQLSANVTVDAETDTLTMVGKWQVSNDNSTWVDQPTSNNAAEVVLATGTSGSDAAVSKAVPAPPGVYGYPWARFVVVNGVTTGASADTYAISYNYRRLDGFSFTQ